MSGECDLCGEHTLDCICRSKKDYIKNCEIQLATCLRRTFEEIDKGSIQVGEDEHHVYFFNKEHECWTTKSKHGVRMKGE